MATGLLFLNLFWPFLCLVPLFIGNARARAITGGGLMVLLLILGGLLRYEAGNSASPTMTGLVMETIFRAAFALVLATFAGAMLQAAYERVSRKWLVLAASVMVALVILNPPRLLAIGSETLNLMSGETPPQ